jgi:Cation transporter/ATPase, N-terminus
MAVHADTTGPPALSGQPWYARTPDAVAAALDVDPGTGLASQRAAELLRANGPKQRGQRTKHVQLARWPACRGPDKPQRSGGLR